MKYLIILGDGMADEKIPELGNMTPLEYAETPYMDLIAQHSRMGMLKTVPEGFHPGSEIANMSILGYDIKSTYEGRGVLEAASMGVPVYSREIAMRCNLICIENGFIKNHSAGHITTEEASVLINHLSDKLGNDFISFYTGVSYRHLLKLRNGDKNILCTPPHDVPGIPFKDVLVKPLSKNAEKTAALINDLIIQSQKLLQTHPINKKRIQEGKDPANSIWPWSPGCKPSMPKITDLFNLKNGVVISAVDLIRGIGIYAGLKSAVVEGVTGLWNTNYEGKAQAAIKAIHDNDFVFLHIEASDEAGHEGDYALKVKTIENLDKKICRPIIEAVNNMNESVSIAVLPDHPTPCRIRTHTASAVPFMIWRQGTIPDGIATFNEFTAQKGSYGTLYNNEFITEFLRQ